MSGGSQSYIKQKKKEKRKKGRKGRRKSNAPRTISFDGFHEGKRRENLPELEMPGLSRHGGIARCFPDFL